MFWGFFLTTGLAIAIMPKREIVVRRWGRMPVAAGWKNDDQKGLATSGAIYGALFAPVAIFLLGPLVVHLLNHSGIVLNL